MLDRTYMTPAVAITINENRGKGKLIEFQNNATPSRAFYIDPDHVVSVKHDGHSY